eukprot:6194201-Pleurochrysis_carterae.AAC.1
MGTHDHALFRGTRTRCRNTPYQLKSFTPWVWREGMISMWQDWSEEACRLTGGFPATGRGL